MTGRADYQDRQENKIERYENAIINADREATARCKQADKISERFANGQPILVGHHSEAGARRDQQKIWNNMSKSVEASEKSEYYANKIESVKSNKAISSDNPEAITLLLNKLDTLEKKREEIKASNKQAKKEGRHGTSAYVLTNLGATIRMTKQRLEKLKRIDLMEDETIKFDGGEIVSSSDINRIQIIYNKKPDEETIKTLKRNGFKWARSEGAWQRLRTNYALRIAKQITI